MSLNSDTQSTIIKALRFPLIVMVVMAHVLPAVFADVQSMESGMDRYVFLSEMLSHNLCKIAVPCFFVLSGYFFFLRIDVLDCETYKSQLGKRVRSLLIPYFLWNLICIICDVLHDYFKGMPMDLPTFQYAFWTGPSNFPFWYMRDLIFLTLITPIIYWFFRFFRTAGWVFLAIAYFVACQDYSLFSGLNIRSFFFFSTGAFLGIRKVSLLEICLNNRKWSLFAVVPLLLVSTWFNSEVLIHHYLLKILYVTGIFAVINMMYSLLDRTPLIKCLTFLSQTVFFIYGIHLIQIEGVFKGLVARSVLAESGLGMTVGYFFVVAMTILTCLLLYFAMKRISPKVLGVLIGNR